MEFYGIRGVPLDWLKSYLHNRKQYVSVEGQRSSMQTVQCGIPQGSVLGPLLFIIYTNDLPHCLSNSKVILFADDTTIFKTSNDLIDLYHSINADLQNISQWFNSNKLYLNVKKTQYILFKLNKREISQDLKIKLGGEVLERKRTIKFLGITLDDNLTWQGQIEKVKSKLTNSLYALRRVKHVLAKYNLKIIYFDLFHPHLEYGLILWGAANATLVNKLFVLQKKAIRLVTGSCYNEHTNPLFSQLKILKLTDMYELHLAKFIYSLYNSFLPLPLQNYFTKNCQIHNYDTRNRENPRIPLHRTNVAARSIFSKSYSLWYTMNPDIKSASSLHVFAHRYKMYLIGRYSQEN